MTNRIEKYVHQSLAGAGFAVLDPAIAAKLRPDLWGLGNGGLEASWEFGRATDMLRGLQGLRRFVMRLDEGSKDIPVVARSSDYLAMRIEWIVGQPVIDLIELTTAKPPATAPMRARAESAGIDRYQGIATAEPGRTCGSCDHFTTGHSCLKFKETGMEHPPANVPHRCMSYVSIWNLYDNRKGPEIWPEILKAKV